MEKVWLVDAQMCSKLEKENRYVIEASTAGLQPGQWPIKVALYNVEGNGELVAYMLELAEVDSYEANVYEANDSTRYDTFTVVILND